MPKVSSTPRVRDLSGADAGPSTGARKRARVDPTQEVSRSVTFYVGAPPPNKRRPPPQRGDPPRASPLRASTSGGTAASPLGLELRGLALDSPLPATSPVTADGTGLSSMTDARRLRRLVSLGWSAIVDSVNDISLVAAEIRDAARREEEVTQRPFGSELAGPYADIPWMLPGGARSLAEIPRLAMDVQAALRAVVAPRTDDVEMEDS